MSDVKISALPVLTCVDVCNSVLPIVQCGVTYQTAACNVGGGGGGGTFIVNSYEPTGIEAALRNNGACGGYSFVNGQCNTIINTQCDCLLGTAGTASTYSDGGYWLYQACVPGNYTGSLCWSDLMYFCDPVTPAYCPFLPGSYNYTFDGTNTIVRVNCYGGCTPMTIGLTGSLFHVTGTNSENASILGGYCNVVLGCSSTVLAGNGNCGSVNTVITGSGNTAPDYNTSISGNFNIISCAAAYDGSCSLSGSYPYFTNGCACFSNYYGDVSAVLPVGSTISMSYLYGQPTGLNAQYNKEVCYSCYNGSYTVLCVTDPTFTFSGYMVKTGAYSSSSYNYQTVCIGGGIFNNITGSAYASTISGGYFNSIKSSSNSTIVSGGCNTISNYVYNAVIGGGYCNLVCGGASVVVSGYRNHAKSYNVFIGTGYQICVSSGQSAVVTGQYGGIGCSSSCSFIGVAGSNYIWNNSSASVIVGGVNHQICDNSFSSFIGGGDQHLIQCDSYRGVVVGGSLNKLCAASPLSVIVGGEQNTIYCSPYSFISGGNFNYLSCVCYSSAIGSGNTVVDNFSHAVGNNIYTDRACTTFVNNLSIKNIPTSAAGLPSGAVWKDTSAGNVLKIV